MLTPSFSTLRLPPIGQRIIPGNLNGILGSACKQASDNTQAPYDLALMSGLVAASISLQGLVDVITPTGVQSPVSLMGFALAGSGERKTAIERLMLKGVRDWQACQKQEYKELLAAWESDHLIWQEKRRHLVARFKKARKDGGRAEEELRVWQQVEPLRPINPAFIYEDTTLAALLQGMTEGEKNAAMLSDEGGALLNGHAFRNLAPLNSLWGGADYSADRKSGESLEIVGGRLTTALSLQPGVLDEYLARKGEHGRDIGFWARALIFAPDSKQGQRFEHGVTRSVEELNAFSIRCQALLDESKDAGGAPRKTICFDESLKPMWVALCNSIEMEIKAGGRFEGLNDHASKLTENIARVAAVLHCFEHDCDGSIGQGSLDWAISICMQCSDDFARIFRVVPQELKDVQAIGCWLVSFRNQGRRYFKKNYILQYGPTGTRSKARLNAALAEMSRRGMLNFVVMGRTTYVDMFPDLIHDQAKFNFDAFLAPPC
ncbi:DUF3987 domain-containing protein [Halopseudomonas aestusnigri]|uniref:YfjI family protein n=1 Tax=Halopseudomonas aestusnigri TaxID=857252 RepID=UPI001E3C46C7|nr:YfjI family protein [Halopseudomonas aestusnigri]UGV31635.1 DUF3987 domain-containing protein [Halopseudomonas aestusnigri]